MKFKRHIFLILVTFGILVRLYRFGQIPESLYWDEVAIGLDAHSIIETTRDLSNNSWLQPLFYSYGDYKAPVYIWLVAVLGLPFGVTEATVRLPSLIISLAMAWILYKLVVLVSFKKSILPFFVILSFLLMPWSFHFSRIGMESHLSLFWLVLMVYLQTLSIKKKKPFLMILAAFSGSLAIYSYIAARIMAVILYIVTPFVILSRAKNPHMSHPNSGGDPSFLSHFFRKVRDPLRMTTVFSFLILILATVFLIKSPDYKASQNYRLSNDNLIRTTEHIEKSVLAQKAHNYSFLFRIFHHRYRYWLQAYAQNYLTHFSPDFLLFKGDNNLRHHSGFGGELLFIQGILLIIGIFIVAFRFLGKIFKIPLFYKTRPERGRKEELGEILMLIWLLASPAAAALVNNEVPHASRAIYMIIPLAWFIGLGMECFYKKSKLIFYGLLFALTANFSFYLHDYFVHYKAHSDIAWLVPYKKAAEYFAKNPTQKKVFITDQWYQPGLYFAFYGNTKISSLQGSFTNALQKFGKFTFHLPNACYPESLCIAPPDWQIGKTEIVSSLPDTEKLVIKRKK